MEKKKLNQKTLTIAGVVVVILLLLIISIYYIYNRINDATINVLVAPSSAKITIDNHTYTNGTYRIPSGKHTVVLSKDDFETIEEEINIKSNETYNYYNYLVYKDGSMGWYADHPDDSGLLETIIPYLGEVEYKSIEQKYPLLSHLPVKEDYYNDSLTYHYKFDISYTIGADNTPIIIITDYTGNNKDRAYEKIRSFNCNPEDYQIRYTDISEPDGWGSAEI